MREILFKAKRIDNGEWVEGCLVIDHSRSNLFEYRMQPVESGALYAPPINPETLCRFTGLCDKNGKRIWENDIVEAWSQGSRAIGAVKQRVDGLWIMSPAWQNHEFWELKPNSNGETTVEVLGNAFDNPELLQEEHK